MTKAPAQLDCWALTPSLLKVAVAVVMAVAYMERVIFQTSLSTCDGSRSVQRSLRSGERVTSAEDIK